MIWLLAASLPWLRLEDSPCSVSNVAACADEAQYSMLYGVAAAVWSADRSLLLLAYQTDHLRWWLVGRAFADVYHAVAGWVVPLLSPAAVLAVTAAMLFFLLAPLFGRIGSIDIRQALVWVAVAPLLLGEAGLWLAQVEELRSSVADILTGQIGTLDAAGIFGAPKASPNEPQIRLAPLYQPAGGASPCPGGPVGRAGPASSPPAGALRADDLAAALLLADAQDIHCPGEKGPEAVLPDRFYAPGSYAEGAREPLPANDSDRAKKVLRLQAGVTRLLQGIVVCLVAVLDAAVQLAYTLCLVVVWLSLPPVALLLLFSAGLQPLATLLRRALSVVLAGWLSGVVLGLLEVCMRGAAGGDPLALVALSCGGLLIAARVLLSALAILTDTLSMSGLLVASSAGELLTLSTAGIIAAAQRGVGGAQGLGDGLAEAGAGARRWAAQAVRGEGEAASSIAPIVAVGSVAAGMGAPATLSADGEPAVARGEPALRAGEGEHGEVAEGGAALAGPGGRLPAEGLGTLPTRAPGAPRARGVRAR